MYMISEYAMCTVLVILVAALFFAACAASVMIWEGSLILSRIASRALDGTPRRVRD